MKQFGNVFAYYPNVGEPQYIGIDSREQSQYRPENEVAAPPS